MERNDREKAERIATASRHADELARTLREIVCDPACGSIYGRAMDRLRWWSFCTDDVAEDLNRMTRETWQ